MVHYKPAITMVIIATELAVLIKRVESYRQTLAMPMLFLTSGFCTSRTHAHHRNEERSQAVTEDNGAYDSINSECSSNPSVSGRLQPITTSDCETSDDVTSGNEGNGSTESPEAQLPTKLDHMVSIMTNSQHVDGIVELDVPVEERYVPGREPSIHERLLGGREYQLHIPPIANFKPIMRKALTRPDIYTQFSGVVSQNHDDQGEYIHGPLKVYDMVKKREIPEFRHATDAKYLEPGEAEMYTWRLERPPDVFIINWSGVAHIGYRDGVVVAAKVLLNITKSQPREIEELLQMIVKEGKLPMWLSTRARYAQPFIDKVADWIPALQFFISNCNAQDMLEQNKMLQALPETKAKPIDILRHITIGGDPNRLVDMGKRQRDAMGITPFELEDWKSDSSRYSIKASTYEQLLKQIGIEEDIVEHHFQHAWERLIEDTKLWKDLITYRTSCDHLDETQRQNHEAFNCAVISAIKHHLEVFQLPLYLLSDIKTSAMVEKEIDALGIELVDGSYVHGAEYGSVEDSICDLIHKLDLDPRVPVHYFDDRLEHLERINKHPDLQHIRTYFVDWGRSTYNEKLGALYSDSIKYVKTSSWMVGFMSTPATQPGREWTHGFRLRRPDEEVAKSMMDWKKKWHKLPEITEVPQRPLLKVT